MIGDPLHWVTALMGGGNALAWDLKYLVAKWLFALGIGLTVLTLTGRLLIASLLCLSSLFIGFFSFRLNHPALCSLCYSPWILYALIRVAKAADIRGAAGWMAVLLLADWMEANSGTVKEASMLTLCLNAAGVLAVLLERESGRLKGRKVLGLLWTQFMLLLVSAPLWTTFLGTLRASFTSYDNPQANQLPPSDLIGFFEDLYYRQTSLFERMVDPSTNFLILLGILWVAVSIPRLARNRAFVALLLGALVPALLVFEGISRTAIMSVPFLKNIAHIDNTFSCVLIVLSMPLAGLGLAACAERMNDRGWTRRFGAVLALLVGLLALYFNAHRHLAPSAFFKGYAPTLLLAIIVIQPAARWLVIPGRGRVCAALLVASCLWAIHWRHAQFLTTAFDDYVFNPQVRADLKASSPAVDYVAAHMRDPGRVDGLGLNLVPADSGMYLREGLYGIDALRSREYEQLAQALGFFGCLILPPPNGRGFQEIPGRIRFFECGLLSRNGRHDPRLGADGRSRPDGLQESHSLAEGFLRHRNLLLCDLAGIRRAHRGLAGTTRFASVDRREVSTLPVGLVPVDGSVADTAVPGRDYSLTNNTTSFTIDAPSPGVAVLTETWLKDDFRVRVNGKLASYFRVNHAFKGVYLAAPGTYRIDYEYWPRHFTAALWAAGSGCALILASLALVYSRPRRAAPADSIDQ